MILFRFRFSFTFIFGVVVEWCTIHITHLTRRTIPFHARIPRFPLMLTRTTLDRWLIVLCKSFIPRVLAWMPYVSFLISTHLINIYNGLFCPDHLRLKKMFGLSSDGSMLFYPAKPSRHQLRKAAQKMKNDCMRNRDPSINQPFIPRTHRPPPKDQVIRIHSFFLCVFGQHYLKKCCFDFVHSRWHPNSRMNLPLFSFKSWRL